MELPSAVLGANGIDLGYVVGGGGGHTLQINNATLQTTGSAEKEEKAAKEMADAEAKAAADKKV